MTAQIAELEVPAEQLEKLHLSGQPAALEYDRARRAYADARARIAAQAVRLLWPTAATLVIDFEPNADIYGGTSVVLVAVRDRENALLWYGTSIDHTTPEVIAWQAANGGSEPPELDDDTAAFLRGVIDDANSAVWHYFQQSADPAASQFVCELSQLDIGAALAL